MSDIKYEWNLYHPNDLTYKVKALEEQLLAAERTLKLASIGSRLEEKEFNEKLAIAVDALKKARIVFEHQEFPLQIQKINEALAKIGYDKD